MSEENVIEETQEETQEDITNEIGRASCRERV